MNLAIRRVRKSFSAYLLLLPLFALLGVFKYYSFGLSLVMSLFDWNGLAKTVFIGFRNYVDMAGDPVFRKSMANLGIVVVFNCAKMLLMSFVAAELVTNIKGAKSSSFFKYVFIIPIIIPTMVTTLLWQWVYDYKGLLNTLLAGVGLGQYAVAFLGAESTALLSILFIGFPWVAGIPFLVMLSGIQTIPESLFENAAIEGVGYYRRLVSIDIPLIVGQIKYVLITTIIFSMQYFEPIQVLTDGGPGNATMTPAMYMYKQAFSFYKFGYSSAIGTFVFIIVMIVTIINLKLLKVDFSME